MGIDLELFGNPSAETIVKIYRLQIYSMYEIKGTVTIAVLRIAIVVAVAVVVASSPL